MRALLMGRKMGTLYPDTPAQADCLCFAANTANSSVALNKIGTPTSVNLQISLDGNLWEDYNFGTVIQLNNIGDIVYFRNKSLTTTGFSTNYNTYYQYVMIGSINASGSINYLLNKNNTTSISQYCYYKLFLDCTSLATAPSLPATNLAGYCYSYMFSGCTNITTPPSLSATYLSNDCYFHMFDGCTSLATAPSLPAISLRVRCYSYMFRGCISLITPPSLPATSLANYCYEVMFSGCTGLTSLPKLSATTLVSNCYFGMFNGCTNIKLSTTQTGAYQTPYRIPVTGTGVDAINSMSYMFTGTGGTFTGAPTINTTYYTSNALV